MNAFVFVGIDVSKAQLDVALRPTGRFSAANTEAGIAEVLTRLQAVLPTLVVMEATGGLEIPLTEALAAAGMPVVVVNPRQIRDFAKATGSWPKPMRWMPRCSRSSPRSCAPSRARSWMRRHGPWPPC